MSDLLTNNFLANIFIFRRALLLALLLLLAAAHDSRAQQRKPGGLRFEPFIFKTNDGKEIPAELGRLTVRENRERPDGNVVELAFVRIKSEAERPGPPIVVLAGGPGGSGLAETRAFWHVFQPLLEVGDVIALEQRGTGRSAPYMMCRNVKGFEGDDLLNRELILLALKERFRPCAEEWRAKGVDVAAYNTRESADDVEDLRRALGVEKINLWGFSFGTQLGFMIIRRHGERIHRAVFAGVEGPDDTRKLPSNIDSHFRDVARLVKADPHWSKLIPDFVGLVRSAHEKLEREPVVVEILNRRTKERNKVRVGSFALKIIVGIDAGDAEDIATFPALFYSISKGDYALLAQRVQTLQDRITAPIPWAMIFPTDCASGATRARDRRIAREAPRSLLGDAINFPWPDVCELWGSPDLGDALRAPVKSRTPALFISGTLDARTPVSNSREMLKGFPAGTLFVVENAGHEDVFSPPAVVEAISDFIKGRPLKATKATHTPLKFAPPKALP